MDRKQLVTIAITAVTSVIAKEFIVWLVALVRNTTQTETVKAKTRTIFNKTNRQTIVAIFWVLLTAFGLWSGIHEPRPSLARLSYG